MKLKITEPEIYRENPFTGDKLERIKNAAILTSLFEKIDTSYVICINASSGNGKTTFIKMFKQHLVNNGYPSVYFNAREADFQENPLIALLGEFYSAIDELKRNGFDIEKAKKTYKKVKKNGKDIIRKAIPVALKTAIHKPLDIEKGVDDAFSEFTSGVLEEQIKNYSLAKIHIQEFRKHLTELVEHLQRGENEQAERIKPLIFFIDELDCCRPDFAVQILDRVKGLFDVDGIIIVIGADMDQLGTSVKNVFGQGMRDRGYLRKFIDLEYNLPTDNNTLSLYCSYLSSVAPAGLKLRSIEDPERALDELNYAAVMMTMTFSLSLRDLNILYGGLNIVLLSLDSITVDTAALAVIILSLRMRHPALFSKLVNKERSIIYFINEMNKILKESDTVKGYDEFFIERRFMALNLKYITNEEFMHQIKSLSLNPGSELGGIYKTIKERNISQENEQFTDSLINSVKMLKIIV